MLENHGRNEKIAITNECLKLSGGISRPSHSGEKRPLNKPSQHRLKLEKKLQNEEYWNIIYQFILVINDFNFIIIYLSINTICL